MSDVTPQPAHPWGLPAWLVTLVRVAAVVYLGIVILAVTWPSGGDIAQVKDTLGPSFLGLVGKDVVLNLGMLVPLTFLWSVGWPRTPWWVWALAGCGIGAAAEFTQWAVPELHRRGSWANVLQNGTGAWVGAACALLWSRWLRR